MDLIGQSLQNIRKDLFYSYKNGTLNTPSNVRSIVEKHQPKFGLDNESWKHVCEFILEIEAADKTNKQGELAEKYNFRE